MALCPHRVIEPLIIMLKYTVSLVTYIRFILYILSPYGDDLFLSRLKLNSSILVALKIIQL